MNTRIKVIRSPRAMQDACLKLRARGKTIGFVPTMGALHDGHLSLIARARRENDAVVVSIFVNPTQFGPSEDYLKYPRPFSHDKDLCRAAGVDILFAPGVAAMYTQDHKTFVNVAKMSDVLCGAARPGHFRGVATVVNKLFNIVAPSSAYFGKKDFQQLAIIKNMVRDLNIPVKIVSCPIIREPSGLARSSRNRYLSDIERDHAQKLSRSLSLARRLITRDGISNPARITAEMASIIKTIPGARIDYIKICNPETLEELKTIETRALIALAIFIGKTRLIDNCIAIRDVVN